MTGSDAKVEGTQAQYADDQVADRQARVERRREFQGWCPPYNTPQPPKGGEHLVGEHIIPTTAEKMLMCRVMSVIVREHRTPLTLDELAIKAGVTREVARSVMSMPEFVERLQSDTRQDVLNAISRGTTVVAEIMCGEDKDLALSAYRALGTAYKILADAVPLHDSAKGEEEAIALLKALDNIKRPDFKVTETATT